MKNYQLELKEQDKKYVHYKNNKIFHKEIKDPGKKLKKEELKNKNKLKKIEEIKIEINGAKERLIRKEIEKYIIEKKEKIKEEETIKLELNNEIQINNKKINKTNISTSSRREEKRRNYSRGGAANKNIQR